jgi:hypothetical protein
VTKINSATTKLSDSSMQANTLTNASLANRTRRVVIGPGEFVVEGGGFGSAQFAVTPIRQRPIAARLGNDAVNAATAVFVVPSDYVSGQPVPKLNIHWATDEAASDRRVDVDVSFTQLSNLTTTTSSSSFRYNFRSGSGGATDAMDSLNPNQGEVVVQTIPEGTESYSGSPTWAAGDVIVLTIGRNGTSGSDPNSGNFYIYAVSFDYTADM